MRKTADRELKRRFLAKFASKIRLSGAKFNAWLFAQSMTFFFQGAAGWYDDSGKFSKTDARV